MSTLQVRPIVDSREALELPAPALTRPLLMVHGLAQKADNWVGLKNFFLTNEHNRWGGVFRTGEEIKFTRELQQRPNANVFAVDLSDALASPRVVASEVRRAITAICRATGAAQVDVITHSMGGLVAREAVRQGEHRIGKLAMLAPPSHGAFEANLAVASFDSGAYEHYPTGHMSAMRDLQLEFGPSGGIANQWMHELNSWWKTAPGKPETVVITGVGMPTPDRDRWPGLRPGDAMVSVRRAPLEGERFMVAMPDYRAPSDPNFRDFQDFFHNHLAILNDPSAFREVADFLGGAPAPPPSPGGAAATSDLEQRLSELQDQNRRIRKELVECEHEKIRLQRYQSLALRVSLAGAGLTVVGLGVAYFSPSVGVPLAGLGLATAVGGAVAYRRYGERALACEGTASLKAEEALNLSDGLVHYLRSQPPAQRPST
ncbi:alpha/beta fold hydrolase [bacterium CPR1]|nr:alpha/beta fold hydrolase [bacterium CPR1]